MNIHRILKIAAGASVTAILLVPVAAVAQHGTETEHGTDANDDNGGDRPDNVSDDGPNHDANDDKGGDRPDGETDDANDGPDDNGGDRPDGKTDDANDDD